jgi:hypothetical protein
MNMVGMMQVRMMIGVLIAIGIMAGLPAGVAAQSDEGLVAEWHFDEGVGNVVKDSSGNRNDGTIYGATFVDGKLGKALSFDGVDDYVSLGNIGTFPSATISFWIYPDVVENHRNPFSAEPVWDDNIRFEEDSSGNFAAGYLCDVGFYTNATHPLTPHKWYHIVFAYNHTNIYGYLNGEIKFTKNMCSPFYTDFSSVTIGGGYDLRTPSRLWDGKIDEVRIFNRALSAEVIKVHYEQGLTALTVRKEVSPYSIRQYQTTNITVQIKNVGTSDIRDIEVVDSTNSNLELIGGEFPNPKKYNSLNPGESRDIRYILKSKESGTFILNPVTVSYADNTGNIKVVKSEPVSLTVVPSSEGSPEISSPSEIGSSSAVLLHGEKTDVVLGEDILLKLSAVNLITKPPISVQVMIYPPSGMSVTGSEFVKSGAGIYTTTYTLNPGDGKDIEVHIKSNQVGDFNVKGRIVYYFGEEKDKAEDYTLNLPIKVRKEPVQTAPSSTDVAGTTAKTPGFEGIIAAIVLLLVLFLKRNR